MLGMIGLLLLALQTSRMPPPPPAPKASEDLNARLRTIVHDYHLDARNFVDGLTRAAGDFQIPIGIEWVDTPAGRAKLSLFWEHATVQKVIASIVESQPGYQMEVKQGIVHVYSPRLIKDRQSFLKLKIGEFEVRGQVVEVASRKLLNLVRLTVSPPKPRAGPGGIGGSLAGNLGEPEITLRLQNVTVEDVLDALALASARKIWIVTFSDDPALTLTGFRRTLTLWNNFHVPDDEQPVWDLLRWGDTLP